MYSSSQIKSLTDAQILLIDASGFTAAELSYTDKNGHTVLSVLSKAQISQLQPSVIASLNNQQLSSLSKNQIAGLTKIQISSLTDAQILLINASGFTAAELGYTDKNGNTIRSILLNAPVSLKLKALSKSQVANLTRAQIASLIDIQIPLIDASALTITQLSYLDKNGHTVLSALNSNQVSHLQSSVVGTLSNAQLRSLTKDQVSALTKDQIRVLSDDQIILLNTSGFTSAQLGFLDKNGCATLSVLSKNQITLLQPSTISSLSNQQLANLSKTQVSGLSKDQVAALTDSQILLLDASGFTVAELSYVDKNGHTVLSDLNLTQIGQLQASVVASLSNKQLGGLTKNQVSGLTESQIASLTDAQILLIDPTGFTIEELGYIDKNGHTILSLLQDPQIAIMKLNGALDPYFIINKLTDPTLKRIATEVYSNSKSLSNFNDAVNLLKRFSDSLTGSLNQKQYSDLQNFTNWIGLVSGKYSSLYALLNEMINDANGAEVDWIDQISGSNTRISHLAVGSNVTQLNQLIAAWFDGSNDPINSSSRNTNGKPLFSANGPTVSDIHQAQVGDCYFLAALQAVVDDSPEFIKSMIQENSNGTYSVRFFHNGAPVWVTVDKDVCNHGAYSTDSCWVSVIERAYAAYKSSFCGTVNSWAGISGGTFKALSQITGDSLTVFSTYQYSLSDWNTVIYEKLKISILEGDAITFSSDVNTQDNTGNTEFIARHMFAITDYDAQTDCFLITNPWGSSHQGGWDGSFEASMNDLWHKGRIAIANKKALGSSYDQLIQALAQNPENTDSPNGDFNAFMNSLWSNRVSQSNQLI